MSIVSFDTPFTKAQAILSDLVSYANAQSYALPTTRYAQIGDIVRDCEAVIVSAGNLVPDPSYDPVTCVYPRSATFLVEIIRGCAVVYNNDGTTNPVAMETVSAQGALDGQLLYDFAGQLDGWTNKQPWSVVWSLAEAGLQVASLQLTIGIP